MYDKVGNDIVAVNKNQLFLGQTPSRKFNENDIMHLSKSETGLMSEEISETSIYFSLWANSPC